MVNDKKKDKKDIDLDEKIIKEDDLENDFDDLEEVKPKKKKVNLDDLDEDIEEEEESFEERIDNIEKKLTVAIILIVITLIFSGVNTIVGLRNNSSNEVDASSDNSSTQAYSYGTTDFKEIKASDIESESKDETIVLWIGRQGCSACQAYAPNIAAIAKEYGVTARYIDLAKIVEFNTQQPYISDDTSWDTLNALTGSGNWATFVKENINGTPLTIVIKKNKVIGGLSGNDTAENIEKMFKDAGFSK